MEQTKRFGGGRLTHRTGREGPRHDPYGYDEWIIAYKADNRSSATLHLGLGVWIDVDDHRIDNLTESECVTLFERIAGISLRTAQRAMDRIPRCCDKMQPIAAHGFPGEHFTVCANCHKAIDYYFNISEVE